MRKLKLIRRIFNLHEDGSRHKWIIVDFNEPVGPHFCEWDYCGCYIVKCQICDEKRIQSSGFNELR